MFHVMVQAGVMDLVLFPAVRVLVQEQAPVDKLLCRLQTEYIVYAVPDNKPACATALRTGDVHFLLTRHFLLTSFSLTTHADITPRAFLAGG